MQRCRSRRVACVFILALVAVVIDARSSSADEIWVVPTFQQDTGGAGSSANVIWPVTKAGAVHLAWAVPNDLACAGPFAQAFTDVSNQLVEIDISALVAPRVGTPGATYLSVVAYTSPNTATDHFVGLRFSYSPR